jgi:hypothetical protein
VVKVEGLGREMYRVRVLPPPGIYLCQFVLVYFFVVLRLACMLGLAGVLLTL